MNIRVLVVLFSLMPTVAIGADAASGARVGVKRVAATAMRVAPTMTGNLGAGGVSSGASVQSSVSASGAGVTVQPAPVTITANDDTDTDTVAAPGGDCRDAYRECMDEFCLLDESEGERCACSDNINKSKSLIQEILQLQSDADKLYTEGVEREQLGAKARLVFGESEAAKKSSRASGKSFSEWLNGDSDDDSLGADDDIGGGLYAMASEFCQDKLAACGAKADMEEMLYSRVIVADCKSFDSYLSDQKSNATANLRTAQAAVRKARLEMLDTTNKYNRGECLLAYRSCIADKGGCGSKFENCLDKALLERRAHACENVLDQCMAVREDVLTDWVAESKMLLDEAAQYVDDHKHNTCRAKIRMCLEDNCSTTVHLDKETSKNTTTDATCLNDINVAMGICPIIKECDELVPGLKAQTAAQLAGLRTQFCENDVDKCLQDKCGKNFTAPECVGKKTSEIAALCPQSMFPACKGETHFDVILSAALMQMDYQMMIGCTNYFSEQLGKVCGTDMSCLPQDLELMSMTQVPKTKEDRKAWIEKVYANYQTATDEFFKRFEKDKTVAACMDSQKPSDRRSLGDSIFITAKQIAYVGIAGRAEREVDSKISELSRQQSLEEAKQDCLTKYAVETPKKGDKNYSYIRSVSFEPDMRNCHVCRMQQVCETGGESKGTAAMKGMAMGTTMGMSVGSAVPIGPWGTAIGGAIGTVAGAIGTAALADGEKEFCQQIESCEDLNM